MKTIKVVAAIITHNDQIFATQRGYGEFKDGWDILEPKLKNSNNSEYWQKKIIRNMMHDDEVNKQLSFLGWTVIRFWGKNIMNHTDECVRVVEETIFRNKLNSTNEEL